MTRRNKWMAIAVGGGLAALVTGCGGGGGGGELLPADITLTIAGKIVGPSPSGAEVAVQVDAQSFVTTAEADGSYTVDITVSETLSSALVTMDAKFTGDQSFVELLSRLGSVSELQSQAGDDDSVDAGENIRTNLSSLSTAEAVLIEEAGSGGKVSLGSGVDARTALTLAAALEVAATNPEAFALPQGTATTLALARSPTQRTAFVSDVEGRAPDSLEQAKQSLIGNPDIVGPVTAADVPQNLLAATLQIGGEFPFNFFNLVTGVQFNANGTGRAFNSTSNAGMTWSLVNNRIRIEYDEPQQFASFDPVDCDGDGFVEQRQAQLTETGFELVPLSAAAVSFSGTSTRTFPDCPQVPAETITSTSALVVLGDANTGSFAVADIADTSFAAPVLLPAAAGRISRIGSDLLQFSANGTGSGTFYLDGFTWSIEAGALVLEFGDGVEARYRPIEAIDGIASGVLADIGAGVERLADYRLAFERDPAATVDVADIAGEYFQYGVGEQNGGDSRLDGFRLLLRADGSGGQRSDFIDANEQVVDTNRPFRWTLEGGKVVLRTYRDQETGLIADCSPQVSTCVLEDTRTLTLVNDDGERFYFVELREFVGDEPGAAVYDARFYDRLPVTAKLAPAMAQRTVLSSTVPASQRGRR
jgi:hypothetical protein